jgi:hypothetical protein
MPVRRAADGRHRRGADDAGFDPSTLVYWRNRIARSRRPHRVNDAVKKVAEQTGILRGRRRRAVDSTILADAVAPQDTVTQLISAIRKVAQEVPGAAGQVAAVCTGHDYSVPGKPKIDWDDPAAKEALVSALVNDATALVAALRPEDPGQLEAPAVALLALVAGQDVEPAEGSDGTNGRWRIARKVAEDRVISTVDPDTRLFSSEAQCAATGSPHATWPGCSPSAATWTSCVPGPTTTSPPPNWPSCSPSAATWTSCAPGPTPATGMPPWRWPSCSPDAGTWTSCEPDRRRRRILRLGAGRVARRARGPG